MSLIDDALKRAREEAARQEATKRSSTSRWAPSHIPGARRSPWKSAAALAAVFVAGGGAAWLLLGQRRAKTVPIPIEIRSVPAPRLTPSAARDVPAPKRDDASHALASSRRPPSGPVSHRSGPSAAGATSPEAAAPGSPSRPAENPPTAARKTFVRMAALASGETIELGGIVYSEGNPVALLNGKVVAPGGSVGDFTVVQIRPDRVDFSGNGSTFSILLR